MEPVGKARETWDSGSPYESYVGRWSRLVAHEFVDTLAVPGDRRWLDVGCGTGALAESIRMIASPSVVIGVDPSDGFIEHARGQLDDERISFLSGDAMSLPFEPDSFDVTVSGLVLNFVPDPNRAVAEMSRVTRPGGMVASYVWDYAEGMELIRRFWDAAVALDPGAVELDEGSRFTLCRREPLTSLFEAAGLDAVTVWPIDVATRLRDFDDYWRPFLGGQGPAPGYASALDAERRAALRDRLRDSLPVDPDGAIELSARAWAVRGSVGP